MKHVIIFLFFFISGIVLHAQNARLVIGCKKPVTGTNPVVQVKFMFESAVISPYSINVFRKASGGNWEKINKVEIMKTPVITVEQLKSSAQTGDEAYKTYQGFMNHKQGTNAMDENNYLAIAGLMIVTDNAFAKYAGCYFEDQDAQNSVTYQYRITDAKQADKELAVSASFTVALNYLPVIPDLSAKQRKDYVYLNWNKQPQFYAYRLYRKKSLTDMPVPVTSQPILLAKMTGETVKDNSDKYKYLDTARLPGSNVYYQVAGLDIMNNESALSKELEVQVRDMIPPHEVSKVKAEKKDKDAVLNWQPVTDKDCIGYNIYRSSTIDTVFKKINTTLLPVNATSYSDKKPPEGTDYAYYIESIDEAGNIAKTHTYKVFFPDVTPPEKPKGLKGILTPGIVKLTWNKNPEGDMLGYFLYRASVKNDKSYFNLISKAPIKENSFTDTLPGVAKNEFVYYLKSVDKYYNESSNSDTIVVHLPDTLAPHAPYINEIKYADKSVILDWQKPSDNDVIGYDIYKSEDSGKGTFRKINANLVKEQTYSDNVIGGKTYYYQVKAKDDANNQSKASNTRAIYIEPDTSALKAAENILADFNKTDSAVHLTWSNSSKNIQGYIIFRKEYDEKTFIPVSQMVTTAGFIDKNVQFGSSYQYMVRSFFTDADIYKNSEAANVKPIQ